MTPARGFTLIEVLAALLVFAVAVTMLVQAGSQRARSLSYLQQRTLATWVASDRITALRLEPGWPEPGTREGVVEMARRSWHWRAEVTDTPDPAVRRVDVGVRIGEDGARRARVTGFLGDPGDRARADGDS